MKNVRLPLATLLRITAFKNENMTTLLRIISPHILNQAEEDKGFCIHDQNHEWALKKDGSRYYVIKLEKEAVVNGIPESERKDRIYLNSITGSEFYFDTIATNFKNAKLGKMLVGGIGNPQKAGNS